MPLCAKLFAILRLGRMWLKTYGIRLRALLVVVSTTYCRVLTSHTAMRHAFISMTKFGVLATDIAYVCQAASCHNYHWPPSAMFDIKHSNTHRDMPCVMSRMAEGGQCKLWHAAGLEHPNGQCSGNRHSISSPASTKLYWSSATYCAVMTPHTAMNTDA